MCFDYTTIHTHLEGPFGGSGSVSIVTDVLDVETARQSLSVYQLRMIDMLTHL